VAVAHGRVQVSAAPDSSGAPPRAPREIAAGQSWLTTLPEPDGLGPALAEALADHERTPPPRGTTVALSITEAPAGAGVWVGQRRIASAPAWVLVEPRAAVRLSAPARAAVSPPEPPSTEPSPPVSEPAARATTPARPRPQLTLSSAALTGRSPLDPAPLAPEEVTARTLFRQADAARAAGDTRLALNTLRALVERFPRDPATAAARYELAFMEQAAADGEAALRDLAAVDSPSLEDPTHYLRCRVLAQRGAAQAGEAERCLAEFRRRFPTSAHDADALATQTALALARGGCPAAQALLAELERRHPAHRSTARLRAACRRGP
jgi:TolA-binding protein